MKRRTLTLTEIERAIAKQKARQRCWRKFVAQIEYGPRKP